MFTRFLHTKLLCSKFCCSIFKDRSGAAGFCRATFLFYHSFSRLSSPFLKFLKKVFRPPRRRGNPSREVLCYYIKSFSVCQVVFSKFFRKNVKNGRKALADGQSEQTAAKKREKTQHSAPFSLPFLVISISLPRESYKIFVNIVENPFQNARKCGIIKTERGNLSTNMPLRKGRDI